MARDEFPMSKEERKIRLLLRRLEAEQKKIKVDRQEVEYIPNANKKDDIWQV